MQRRTTLLGLILPFVLIGSALAAGWGFSGSKAITAGDHVLHMQDSMYYMEQWSGTVYFGENHNLNFNLVYSKLTTASKKGMFRVEYNTPDGKTIEDSQRCDLKFKTTPLTLMCGKGAIAGPIDKLKLQWSGDKLPVILNMEALAKPFRPGNGRLVNKDDAGEFYDFLLMVPRAKVVAKVGDQVLQGNGVVDHSYANIGLHKISRHWLRNTYIDKDLSVIFAANWTPDGSSTGWVSITDKDGNHYASKDVTYSFADTWKDEKKDGYYAPRTISVKATDGSGFKMDIPSMTFKDRKDMLSHLSSVESFVVRRFSDPMRYNFVGTATITWPAGGALRTDTRKLTVSIKQLND